MTRTRIKLTALALVSCFAVLLLPILASAQLGGVVKGTKEGVQKGTQEIQKGAEGAVDKTREGAEAVGQGTKKVITGEDSSTSEQRMKPQESQSSTSTSSTTTETESSRTGESTKTGQKQMPRTAGELPLLALAGCFSLSAAGVTLAVRRKRAARIL